MQISFDKDKDFLRVILGGEIDMSVTDIMRKRIDDAIDKGTARNLVFDLSHVIFIDSSGLGVIMGRYRRLLPLGGIVVIFGANERVYRILELSGITKLLRVHRNDYERGRLINE